MNDKPTVDRREDTSADRFAAAPGADDPKLDPFEIEFRPEFASGRGPRRPFINDYGIVIGDHDYASPDSPLERWSEETDPAVMAGDQWVHPYKDIGFRTSENRNLFERGIAPSSSMFMHPEHQTAGSERYEPDFNPDEDEGERFGPLPEVLDEP